MSARFGAEAADIPSRSLGIFLDWLDLDGVSGKAGAYKHALPCFNCLKCFTFAACGMSVSSDTSKWQGQDTQMEKAVCIGTI